MTWNNASAAEPLPYSFHHGAAGPAEVGITAVRAMSSRLDAFPTDQAVAEIHVSPRSRWHDTCHLGRCQLCGCDPCECPPPEYDADELGLDPEDDIYTQRRGYDPPDPYDEAWNA